MPLQHQITIEELRILQQDIDEGNAPKGILKVLSAQELEAYEKGEIATANTIRNSLFNNRNVLNIHGFREVGILHEGETNDDLAKAAIAWIRERMTKLYKTSIEDISTQIHISQRSAVNGPVAVRFVRGEADLKIAS